MFDLGKEWTSFECPKCKYEIDIQLIDLNDNEQTYCNNCKVKIQFDDKNASVETSIKKINNALRNLGK